LLIREKTPASEEAGYNVDRLRSVYDHTQPFRDSPACEGA
jgi:hypothetical protein